MRHLTLLAAACLLAAFNAPADPPEVSDRCTCIVAQLRNGWCGPCATGYLAGVPIRSAIFFESLDPHGHDVEIDTLECPRCRAAASRNDYCDECRRGFSAGQLHVSKISWLLARGEAMRLELLGCAACRGRVEETFDAAARGAAGPGPAWCEACRAGMVGNVAIRRRADFGAARLEFERFLRALREVPRCEYCAVAAIYDATCPACRITWCDGWPE